MTKIVKSKITTEYHHHGKEVKRIVAQTLMGLGIDPIYIKPKLRAGNLIINGVPKQERILGKIKCYRHNMDGHVVLPDGRTVLCCMDYSMKHVLGNLATSSYADVHAGKANKEIDEAMLDDKKMDLLCRYCHNAVPVDEYDELKNMKMSLAKIKKGIKMIAFKRNRPSVL